MDGYIENVTRGMCYTFKNLVKNVIKSVLKVFKRLANGTHIFAVLVFAVKSCSGTDRINTSYFAVLSIIPLGSHAAHQMEGVQLINR